MSDETGGPPAGWFPDPEGRHEHRWWDGSTWTDQVADAGVAATDPMRGGAAPAGGDADATLVDQGTTVGEGQLDGGFIPGPGQYVSDMAVADAPEAKRVPVGVLAAIAVGVAALAALIVLAVGAVGGDDDGEDTSSVDGDMSDEVSDDVDDALSDLSDDLSGLSDDFSFDFSDDFSDDLSFDLSDDFSDDSFDDLELGPPVLPEDFISEHGSDSGFDALADDCFDGDLAACDQLYATTPIDDASSYEGYGATCGGRLPEEAPGTCSDRG